jgi:hypothetical protein
LSCHYISTSIRTLEIHMNSFKHLSSLKHK